MREFKCQWQPKVSVVLPSYNEKENVREVVTRIANTLGKELQEIIVVDDNSPDGTWKLVKELIVENKKVKLIHRIKEKGLASALDDGIRAAKGNVVVWMDCDLGLPPEEVPRLVEKIRKYDVAIGSRYVCGGKDLRPMWRAALSTMLNWYSSLMLGWQVRDYTSGFVAVRKEVLDYVQWERSGFGEYFAEFVYKCLKIGFDVTEVGYHYKDRTKGISKTKGMATLVRYGWQYGCKVLKLRFPQSKILSSFSKPIGNNFKLHL